MQKRTREGEGEEKLRSMKMRNQEVNLLALVIPPLSLQIINEHNLHPHSIPQWPDTCM
jgi:hypothetical protein